MAIYLIKALGGSWEGSLPLILQAPLPRVHKKSKKSRSSGGFQWSYEKHEKISKYDLIDLFIENLKKSYAKYGNPF